MSLLPLPIGIVTHKRIPQLLEYPFYLIYLYFASSTYISIRSYEAQHGLRCGIHQLIGAPSQIRTETIWILSPLPLPVGIMEHVVHRVGLEPTTGRL